MDAERQRLGRLDDSSVGRERFQRVDVGRTRVGVLRRHRAATDVSLRHDDRLAEPDATAEPLVLLVLAEPVDAEVHAEAPLVDLVHAEGPCERAQGAGPEQRRRPASKAIRRRPGSRDEPKVAAREFGDRLAPGPVDDAGVNRCTPEPRAQRAVEADLLGDRRAVGKRERQQARLAVVARDDLLEAAEPLAVHEPVVLVHEEELPISRDPGLGQLAEIELPDRETLDRAMRDPGDAQGNPAKPSAPARPQAGAGSSTYTRSPRWRRRAMSYVWCCERGVGACAAR